MPRRPGKERVKVRISVEVDLDVDKGYKLYDILKCLRSSVEFGIGREVNHVIAGDINHRLRGTKAVQIVGYVRDWRIANITGY